MPVKIYVSGISGNKEVKKRQQRVLMILDSRNFKYDLVDITEPGNEGDKDFMQTNSKSMGCTVGDTNPRHALPPQIFNDQDYCGDYDQFDLANENDELEKFLKLVPSDSTVTSTAEMQLDNGKTMSDVVENEENEAKAMQGEPKEDTVDSIQDNEVGASENNVDSVKNGEAEAAEDEEEEEEDDN